LVNRQRQLLVWQQLEQLSSELAQLKTDESGLVALVQAKPDAEPEPDAELYRRMQQTAQVHALAPCASHAATYAPATPAVAHCSPALRQLLVPGLKPRDFQLRAAAAAINGRDVFVIESAGSGKTLAAWFAGLIVGGVTLFISPLIALASEQAAKLNASNSGAVLLHGGEIAADVAFVAGGRQAQDFMGSLDGSVAPATTRDALAKLLRSSDAEAIREGTDEEALLLRAKELRTDLKPANMFIFTSPEKVALSASFRALLARLYALKADDGQRLLRLCVLDEAHCVDEHGHSFRPCYRSLGALRDAFAEVPLMMLTATAPPISVLSICATLGVNDPLVLRGDLSRRQMQYTTVTVSGVRQRDAVLVRWLLQRLYAGERGIVYVGSRRRAELLAERLRVGLCELDSGSLLGDAAELMEHYHAGLSEGQRDEVELRWRNGEHSILVATIAWGMGMDDAAVRFTAHDTPSSSLMALYQEASRGGRDGRPAHHILLFSFSAWVSGLERACGDLGEGELTRAYAEGRYLDLLEWYTDTTSCRHAIFEKYVGDPSRNVKPCAMGVAGEPACDNCRRSGASPLVVRRGDWLGALQQVWRDVAADRRRKRGPAAGPPTLRKLASAWRKAMDSPPPAPHLPPEWARLPLLCHALLLGVVGLDFAQVCSAPSTACPPSHAPACAFSNWRVCPFSPAADPPDARQPRPPRERGAHALGGACDARRAWTACGGQPPCAGSHRASPRGLRP